MPIPVIAYVVGAAGVALIAAKIARDKKLATPIQVNNAGVQTPALTGTNGTQFLAQSPQFSAAEIIPADQFLLIIPTDQITVDAERSGLVSSSIPNGNVLMQVVTKPDPSSMTLLAISKDPRNDINDVIPKVIPQKAVTGVAPAP